MSIPDILSNPWAITQAKMEEILTVWDRHIAGEKKLDILAAPVARRTDAASDDKRYTVTDSGVAVISVDGVIAKKMNLFTEISGGTSTEVLSRAIAAALADPDVKALVLDINSPGGTVGGVDALSSQILDARAIKPIVAYADGQMTSAAYWIGSAASTIIAAKAAMVGSIGVLMVHYDYSAADAQAGVKRTYLTAGKYKALGNDAEPLSDFARATIEELLNDAYTQFVDSVAQNRNVAVEKVLEDMADGRIFTGKKALAAGLVDRLGTLDTAVKEALTMAATPRTAAMILGTPLKSQKEEAMEKFTTLAELSAAYPDFAAQLKTEGANSVDLETPKREAAKAERERVLGITSVALGDEIGGKITAIVESGVTVEQYRAVGATLTPPTPAATADAALKAQLLAGIKGAGAAAVGADAGATGAATGSKDYIALVDEYMAAHKCTRVEAMQAVTREHPEAQKDYIRKANANAGRA
jgi:signal peptide peptidase SppA